MAYVLLASVFVIATCGLVYELIAGTLASYLLGDSVTQFSTVIGTYLFAMGIGSWLSKFVRKNEVTIFIRVELLIALVGGSGAAVLFLIFAIAEAFRIALYGQVVLTGVLVGLEIPLLMRILKDRFEFKDLVSNIFTYDYIGALAASLLFPMVLVPQLGLVRTGFLFGIFNVLIALWALYLFRDSVRGLTGTRISGIVVFILLVLGFIFGNRLMDMAERVAYQDTIIYSTQTPYQRIVLTRSNHDYRLYLNGNLQFSSADEYRYHEALVHPGLQSVRSPKRVLVLGGGDGLAVREILRNPAVDSVLLVDLDPEMTRLFSTHSTLTALNDSALLNPRVRVLNADAYQWIRADSGNWDFICADFPDPSHYSVGKLYTLSFFREMERILSPGGRAVVQSTSPYFAPKSYWCIVHTLAAAGLQVTPYHTLVPSFGEWGYVLAGKSPYSAPGAYPEGLRYLDANTFAQMLHFPKDMEDRPTEVNRLNNQALVQYFEDEWGKYNAE